MGRKKEVTAERQETPNSMDGYFRCCEHLTVCIASVYQLFCRRQASSDVWNLLGSPESPIGCVLPSSRKEHENG